MPTLYTKIQRRALKLGPVARAYARWHWWRGYINVAVLGHEFRCDPQHWRFWHDVHTGVWDPNTFRTFADQLQPGDLCYDIGAWIGPTTIFAAKRCRRVVSFEPDPEAFRYLAWNLRLNQLRNVTPICAALSHRTALLPASSFGGSAGDSMTSLLNPAPAENAFSVLTFDWEAWRQLAGPEKIAFIKIDIEGGEIDLLPAMRAYLRREKPTLLLSTHYNFIPDARRAQYVDLVREIAGYYASVQDERLQPLTVDETALRQDFRSLLLKA